jgi:hypothetical protein
LFAARLEGQRVNKSRSLAQLFRENCRIGRPLRRAGDVALDLSTNVNVACDVLLDLPLDLPAVRRAPASAGARA